MSFKDIIKGSILDNFANQAFTIKETAYLLIVSMLVGMFIFIIYRLVCRSGFYSKAFNISLVVMPVITATIIVTIQTSVVVSLGMVGALSIVRFRTALKNPLDLIFMFWSISAGIVTGAGLPAVVCIMSLVVAIILLLLNLLPVGAHGKLLNICTKENAADVEEIVKQFDKKAKLKSQSFNGQYTNMLFIVSSKCGIAMFDGLKKNKQIISFTVVEQEEQQF